MAAPKGNHNRAIPPEERRVVVQVSLSNKPGRERLAHFRAIAEQRLGHPPTRAEVEAVTLEVIYSWIDSQL